MEKITKSDKNNPKIEKSIFLYYNLDENNKQGSLFNNLDFDDMDNMIFIAREYKDNNNKKRRNFARFGHQCDFYDLLLDSQTERHFHEVIITNRGLKPYLDIDIKKLRNILDAEKVLGRIITASISVFDKLLKKTGKTLKPSKDIRIHTSHGQIGKDYKYSYLVIFDNYYVDGLEKAKYIYDLIIEELKEKGLDDIIDYIDSQVYSPKHTMRCMGSAKLDDNRVRKLEYNWNYYINEDITTQISLYKKPEYKDDKYGSGLEDLERSLITCLNYGKGEEKCIRIPIDIPEKVKRDISEIELKDKDIKKILDKLSEEIDIDDFEPNIDNIKNNCIQLQRKRPSYCKICEREHDNDNQYVSFTEKTAYLKCHRNREDYIDLEVDIKGYKNDKSDIRESDEESEESNKEKNKKLKYPSQDPYWNMIIKDSHKGHKDLFLKLAKDECFSVNSDDEGLLIFIINKNNMLWEKYKNKRKLINKIMDINVDFMEKWKNRILKTWKSKRKSNKKSKDIIDIELNILREGKYLANAKNQNWTSSIAELVISEIENEDRYKLLNRTQNKISFPPCHVVDLITGEITKRKPEDNWSKELTIPYVEKSKLNKEKRKHWKKILAEIALDDKEFCEILQMILGSALTGISYRRYFYYIQGNPSSAKSILLKILATIMGKFATQGDKYMLASRKDKGPINSGIVRTGDKRLVYLPEFDEFDVIDDDYVNKVIGGDYLTGRNPHKEEVVIDPMYMILIASNSDPNIKTNTFWNKINRLLMQAEFVNKPNPKLPHQKKIDRDFRDKILKDIEMMKVILYWLVKGAIKFNKQGKYIPILKSSVESLKKLKYQNDTLGLCINEMALTPDSEKEEEIRQRIRKEMKISENIYNAEFEDKVEEEFIKYKEDEKEINTIKYKIKTTDFHNIYREFLEREGIKEIPSTKKIVASMKEKGFIKEHGTADYYLNISLKPEYQRKRR